MIAKICYGLPETTIEDEIATIYEICDIFYENYDRLMI
ncbi:hypothetical protein STRDD11_01015 [Streptococcus sp. DD11]|nr:hypothetical protein STRDD11_01015 [Streptococcus sp. DD11]